MNLTVNCRVLCVNDAKPNDFQPHHFPNWVKKGEEYHIRKILNNDDIVVGVLLKEIVNPVLFIPLINALQEGAFATWRFEVIKSAGEVYSELRRNESIEQRRKREEQERLDYDILILNTDYSESYIFK